MTGRKDLGFNDPLAPGIADQITPITTVNCAAVSIPGTAVTTALKIINDEVEVRQMRFATVLPNGVIAYLRGLYRLSQFFQPERQISRGERRETVLRVRQFLGPVSQRYERSMDMRKAFQDEPRFPYPVPLLPAGSAGATRVNRGSRRIVWVVADHIRIPMRSGRTPRRPLNRLLRRELKRRFIRLRRNLMSSPPF